MADHVELPLVELPAPEVPTGSIWAMADDVKRLLRRLSRFTGSSGATVRHVWLQVVDRQLVGHAFDLASGAQATAKILRPSTVPLIGISPKEIAKLARGLGKVTGQVQLTLVPSTDPDAPPGATDLVAIEGDRELSRAALRLPVASDERFLGELIAELLQAHEMTRNSELPHGYGDVCFAKLGKLRDEQTTAGMWWAPNGRLYIHVDDTFQVFFKAARAGHGRASRPTAPAPLSTIPTGKAAA